VKLIGQGTVAVIDAGWIATLPFSTDATVDPDLTTCAASSLCTATSGDRVFHIVAANGSTVTTLDVQMSNLTIKGGKATTVSFLGPDNQTYDFRRDGGGVASALTASVFVPTAGGVPTDPGVNGGNGGPGGIGGEEGTVTYTFTIDHSLVTSNYGGDGGGIYTPAAMTASYLTVSGNRAKANGGGIYNDATATMLACTLSGNSAEGGGGLFDTGSHITTIVASTISKNAAVGGGGISARAGSR